MAIFSEYFYNTFPNQLKTIVEPISGHAEYDCFVKQGDLWRNLKKIPLEDRGRFVLSLLMIVLSDQALYRWFPNYYAKWRANTNFPKFGYIIAGDETAGLRHNDPFAIFGTADNDEFVAGQVAEIMPEFVHFFVEETKKYFSQLFGNGFDVKQYFKSILNDTSYVQSDDDKTTLLFKKHFEEYLKESDLI